MEQAHGGRRLSPGQRLLNRFLVPHRGYAVLSGRAYGDDPEHRLDVYRPQRPDGSVVVFFYGGRWSQGHRSGYRFVGQALASLGTTVVIPDYRLYPSVRFPAFMHDAAAAVAWTRAHAGELGADSRRVVLMGHSAGAHIASLLALDAGYLEAVGRSPRELAGVVGLAGPYDFLPLREPDLRDIFGPEARHALSQPINFAGGEAPPFLLLTGGRDRAVSPGNSKRLWRRLTERGTRARLVFYRRLGHTSLMAALAAPLRMLGPVLPEIGEFVRQTAVAGELPDDFGRAPVERQGRHRAA
ncbi:MAG TPA: alpha/beta hydrolase [Gammaproteobacteria bacterium]|nr:alpha/beta hydrolase [Gammaproteobacteria bacterium]